MTIHSFLFQMKRINLYQYLNGIGGNNFDKSQSIPQEFLIGYNLHLMAQVTAGHDSIAKVKFNERIFREVVRRNCNSPILVWNVNKDIMENSRPIELIANSKCAKMFSSILLSFQ